MGQHEKFDQMAFGKNEEGETVAISVNKDNITVETYQKNGWVRENIYWEDRNVEELYHKYKE